ncbi:hypothetical protein SBRCBS47491_001508 [Sporothrix bragantina]|uniref:Uncharacterized protein n=1 Tax=Sporothrix bragantina TaxID=671064 RepID=A0ABP0AZ69_9PEZI
MSGSNSGRIPVSEDRFNRECSVTMRTEDNDSDTTLDVEDVSCTSSPSGASSSGESFLADQANVSAFVPSCSASSSAAAADLHARVTRSTGTHETVVRSGPLRGQTILFPCHPMTLRSESRAQSQAEAQTETQVQVLPRRANNSSNPPPRGSRSARSGHGSGCGGRRC